MGVNKNIGKNTIGDNNKMQVYLHDYNMSTHDLSTITRTTMSPGTLVPTMKLLVQKGDVLDIDIESNVLTHPTVGPLFGSFKLENHIYFGAMRLYNSWLHNNRTKIGLDMSQIKLPILGVSLDKTLDQPICMARKPLEAKTVAENCLKWGTGGINIDESRVGTEQTITRGRSSGGTYDIGLNNPEFTQTNTGRFPANLLHDNSEEVRECFPNESERFFKSIIYQAKASKSERNRGCDGLYILKDNTPKDDIEEIKHLLSI